ncbi:TetR/AcrR family transcriptional regulator [Shinella sp. BYT-45]|uniref:TetR/AcrR family transcriptional regulator n=1 Tax=Shinella sp. BYT-45 TaxID=3377377 RepID=UPI0039818BCB
MTGPSAVRNDRHPSPISKSTKDDWIAAAVDILILEGIDQVKIQVISKRLGVSRSSFYWFFKDIGELQDELLSYWLRRNTGPVIERAMRPAKNLTEAVCNVFECWINPSLFDSSLDTVVRFWARKDPNVRSIVEQADRQRIEALTHMFSRYGMKDGEAFIRARVLYFTQVGYFALEVRESLETRTKHLRNYLLAHMGSEPDESALEAYIRRIEGLKGRPA